ncbi:MAG: FAD-dependent oxidoreductase [Deltaproteobacteria bacterium]|nr:FAD-dependent oxidoreductase [Deltaproteobacteria bacterium]
MSSGPIRARLSSMVKVSRDVTDLRFALETPPVLDFKPGQFVTFAVGKDDKNQPIRRSYSLAGLATRGHELRMLVKLLPDGAAGEFFASLAADTVVEMTGPHGFFVLDAVHEGDVVLAATGTGLAPILPMLHDLAQRQEVGHRYVYWGLRGEDDLFLYDELLALCEAAQAELFVFLSQGSDAWTGLRGRITIPILERLPLLKEPTFYMVGNGAMIRELKQELMDRGINRKKQIRTEAFFD